MVAAEQNAAAVPVESYLKAVVRVSEEDMLAGISGANDTSIWA